jgi:UDP-glucuronate 4-epimerase
MFILVTGGAGFIGSHLCEALLERGDCVTALDNFDPFYSPALKRRNLARALKYETFSLVEGDIRGEGLLKALFTRCRFDAVVHLAALAGVRESLEQPRQFEDVNVLGTLELLEAARQHGLPRFILASTSSVYGLSPNLPYREDDPLLAPVSIYGATKIACEKYGHVYYSMHGLPLISLRFFTAYGPRQRPDMAIHKFALRILAGEELPVYGAGGTSRDYTYIADIVQGVLAALDSPRAYGVYNLGNNVAFTLREVIAQLEQALGREAKLRHLPEQPGDPPHTCANIDRALAELGFRPATPLAAGIAAFTDWLLEEQAAARKA